MRYTFERVPIGNFKKRKILPGIHGYQKSQVKKITEEERELVLKISEIPYEERDHALYIAYGPYKNPRYAVSVIVEHEGSGSVAAAPIAKKLFKLIIDRHELREKNRLEKFINT